MKFKVGDRIIRVGDNTYAGTLARVVEITKYNDIVVKLLSVQGGYGNSAFKEGRHITINNSYWKLVNPTLQDQIDTVLGDVI